MLTCLPYHETTIGVFLKHQFECKSSYMIKNVCANLIMLTLKYLISTIFYTNLNVTIHFKWTNLFVMHTTLYTQMDGKNMSLFDSSNSKNEKHIDCVAWYTTFKMFSKLMIMKCYIFYYPKIHPLCLFK